MFWNAVHFSLLKPTPSVDGRKKGSGSDGKSLPAASNGISNIKWY